MKEITINVNSVSVGNDEVVLKLSWDEYDKLKAINESLLSALKDLLQSYSMYVKKADQSEYVINAKEAIKLAEQ